MWGQHASNTANKNKTNHTRKTQGQQGLPWAGRSPGSAEPKEGPSRPCFLLDLDLYLYFCFPYVPMKILRKMFMNKN